MNHNKIAHIFVFFVLITLYLLSFRSFLFSSGNFGHNWDWTFPSLDIFSEKLNILSIFTWDNYNLGGVVNLTILHLLTTSLFVLLGKMFSITTILFLLFFFVRVSPPQQLLYCRRGEGSVLIYGLPPHFGGLHEL